MGGRGVPSAAGRTGVQGGPGGRGGEETRRSDGAHSPTHPGTGPISPAQGALWGRAHGVLGKNRGLESWPRPLLRLCRAIEHGR